MKYTIVENASVKRIYEIEAESADAALDKMYSGKFEPTADDEEGDSIFIYDENGKNVSGDED